MMPCSKMIFLLQRVIKSHCAMLFSGGYPGNDPSHAFPATYPSLPARPRCAGSNAARVVANSSGSLQSQQPRYLPEWMAGSTNLYPTPPKVTHLPPPHPQNIGCLMIRPYENHWVFPEK